MCKSVFVLSYRCLDAESFAVSLCDIFRQYGVSFSDLSLWFVHMGDAADWADDSAKDWSLETKFNSAFGSTEIPFVTLAHVNCLSQFDLAGDSLYSLIETNSNEDFIVLIDIDINSAEVACLMHSLVGSMSSAGHRDIASRFVFFSGRLPSYSGTGAPPKLFQRGLQEVVEERLRSTLLKGCGRCV